MVRWRTPILAVLSAQASRSLASRIGLTDADLHAVKSVSEDKMTAVTGIQSDITAVGNERGIASRMGLTDADLHAARSTGEDNMTAVTGLQSDITAVGNELQSDAARHNSSGGVASIRSHLAQAGKRLADAASAVGLLLLGALVVTLCFACCFWDRLLSGSSRRQPITQATGQGASSSNLATGSSGQASSKDLSPNRRSRRGGTVRFESTGAFSEASSEDDGDRVGREPTLAHNTALYDSLRELSKRIQGPVNKLASSRMHALVYGKQNRYIAVQPSSDDDPASRWRNAQLNMFMTVEEFTQGAEPYKSVRVSDIENVSWHLPDGDSNPQIVLTTNQRRASSRRTSAGGNYIYLFRQTQEETQQLLSDLLKLSDLVNHLR